MARKVLPVPWFPQANGPLRPVDLLRPLDGEAPGRCSSDFHAELRCRLCGE